MTVVLQTALQSEEKPKPSAAFEAAAKKLSTGKSGAELFAERQAQEQKKFEEEAQRVAQKVTGKEPSVTFRSFSFDMTCDACSAEPLMDIRDEDRKSCHRVLWYQEALSLPVAALLSPPFCLCRGQLEMLEATSGCRTRPQALKRTCCSQAGLALQAKPASSLSAPSKTGSKAAETTGGNSGLILGGLAAAVVVGVAVAAPKDKAASESPPRP